MPKRASRILACTAHLHALDDVTLDEMDRAAVRYRTEFVEATDVGGSR
ncbi:MAG: hypothetical protein WBA11_14480 [Rubrivirga sp.]